MLIALLFYIFSFLSLSNTFEVSVFSRNRGYINLHSGTSNKFRYELGFSTNIIKNRFNFMVEPTITFLDYIENDFLYNLRGQYILTFNYINIGIKPLEEDLIIINSKDIDYLISASSNSLDLNLFLFIQPNYRFNRHVSFSITSGINKDSLGSSIKIVPYIAEFKIDKSCFSLSAKHGVELDVDMPFDKIKRMIEINKYFRIISNQKIEIIKGEKNSISLLFNERFYYNYGNLNGGSVPSIILIGSFTILSENRIFNNGFLNVAFEILGRYGFSTVVDNIVFAIRVDLGAIFNL